MPNDVRKIAEKEKMDPNDAIFERMVIVVPYKSPEIVTKLMNCFDRINLAGLNLESVLYLNTKEFTEEEK